MNYIAYPPSPFRIVHIPNGLILFAHAAPRLQSINFPISQYCLYRVSPSPNTVLDRVIVIGEGAGPVLVVYFGIEGYVAAFSAGDVGYVEGVGESEG